ncbi:hypothetical protein PSACC_02687 [Paramicrosporidium saccamoebae]|uniref:Uncharacterized protein n=1 Tax=Paramicrosporidium saccamoebae TaxID=1246581 RepID=A0A2H9TIB7_9FUNG|nr:hypothetical protein PSACC_02687 [Paramicrosporidium saccamoebae]
MQTGSPSKQDVITKKQAVNAPQVSDSQSSIQALVDSVLLSKPKEVQKELGHISVKMVKPRGEPVAIENFNDVFAKDVFDLQCQSMGLEEGDYQGLLMDRSYYPVQYIPRSESTEAWLLVTEQSKISQLYSVTVFFESGAI